VSCYKDKEASKKERNIWALSLNSEKTKSFGYKTKIKFQVLGFEFLVTSK